MGTPKYTPGSNHDEKRRTRDVIDTRSHYPTWPFGPGVGLGPSRTLRGLADCLRRRPGHADNGRANANRCCRRCTHQSPANPGADASRTHAYWLEYCRTLAIRLARQGGHIHQLCGRLGQNRGWRPGRGLLPCCHQVKTHTHSRREVKMWPKVADADVVFTVGLKPGGRMAV